MTNHWIDLRNTDCALILGSNAAENHPISFKWLTHARENRGAKIIHVDPRFTRTSAKADIYAPLRSGTDIAFVGGMINYILENDLYFKDYVVNYTNAAYIVDDGFDFKDGLFSGYDAEKKKYNQDTWVYKTGPDGKPLKDMTLQHPRCVFQLLKKHYARYDVDTVVKVTGTPKDKYLEICKTYAATGRPDKAGTIMYAMGTTQHTVGSQNVRIYAILQLLLGNIGIPGGGVQALRGESNVQGSTDYGLLFHILPGYIATPSASPEHATLKAFLEKETPKAGFKVNTPKWVVSYLKAMWGPAATPANEFAYHYLPKRDPDKNYSHIALFEAMYRGEIKGAMLWGQNPVVGGPNSSREKEALKRLDWMVAVDLFPTETMHFWTREAGEDPAAIKTEVFVLPACSSYEKEGSIASSGRWIQWRWKATAPVGEAKADLEIMHLLATKLKEAYAGSPRPEDAPIRDLFWDYGHGEEIDIDKVVREINGYDVKTKKQVNNFLDLKDDGTTCCGNWIMSGVYPEEGNLAKRRNTVDKTGIGQFLEWAWAWPLNRRILYNRASADLTGKPWSADKAVIWWDPTAIDPKTGKPGKWVGKDVPDFKATCPPTGSDFPFVGNQPFIMLDDGVAGLFAKKGMKEGPFPEHYEPWESPVKNIINPVQVNPVVKIWNPDEQSVPGRFPYVATTYRVSEHWQTGAMTRNLPWQCELVPEMFVEMSKALADQLGIANGEWVIVENMRGRIKAKAMVTERFQPIEINGKKVHQVGLPWHFGFKGFAKGAIANELTPHIGDGNTMIPEYKAFLVNIRRAK
ncbi:formate dehydrogenase, alpha subunit [Thermincola potens JR]|nr:formate dehydrogenase, alpha subunit [Thermincola potens JR]